MQILSQPSLQFWILTAFVGLVFMTGGASRTDVQSQVILLPVSILACGIAAAMLRKEHITGHKGLLAGFAAIMALLALYILPLPAPVWQGMTGRAFIADIDLATGLGEPWRPLSLVPVHGWNSLASLFVPLAVLLLGIQLSREDLYRLLPVLIAGGALSGLFGLMQVAGSPEGPLYLYRITNNGSAVGLFANRNHAATLLACLFPMLAVFASAGKAGSDGKQSRQLVAAIIAIILIPLILVTGSRAGLLTAVLGLGGAALLYRHQADRGRAKEKEVAKKRATMLAVAMVVVSLGLLTIYFARAEAIDRMFAAASDSDNRSDYWAISSNLFWQYFPWGFGPGSFVDVFRMSELPKLLDATYLNRVHNDWMEIAITYGVAGVLGLAIAAFFYIRRSFRLWRHGHGERRAVTFGRLASIAIMMIAIASISDYPLRTPIMMTVFAILLLWFVEPGKSEEPGSHPLPR